VVEVNSGNTKQRNSFLFLIVNRPAQRNLNQNGTSSRWIYINVSIQLPDAQNRPGEFQRWWYLPVSVVNIAIAFLPLRATKIIRRLSRWKSLSQVVT